MKTILKQSLGFSCIILLLQSSLKNQNVFFVDLCYKEWIKGSVFLNYFNILNCNLRLNLSFPYWFWRLPLWCRGFSCILKSESSFSPFAVVSTITVWNFKNIWTWATGSKAWHPGTCVVGRVPRLSAAWVFSILPTQCSINPQNLVLNENVTSKWKYPGAKTKKVRNGWWTQAEVGWPVVVNMDVW